MVRGFRIKLIVYYPPKPLDDNAVFSPGDGYAGAFYPKVAKFMTITDNLWL